jgi:hypothetical protein
MTQWRALSTRMHSYAEMFAWLWEVVLVLVPFCPSTASGLDMKAMMIYWVEAWLACWYHFILRTRLWHWVAMDFRRKYYRGVVRTRFTTARTRTSRIVERRTFPGGNLRWMHQRGCWLQNCQFLELALRERGEAYGLPVKKVLSGTISWHFDLLPTCAWEIHPLFLRGFVPLLHLRLFHFNPTFVKYLINSCKCTCHCIAYVSHWDVLLHSVGGSEGWNKQSDVLPAEIWNNLKDNHYQNAGERGHVSYLTRQSMANFRAKLFSVRNVTSTRWIPHMKV